MAKAGEDDDDLRQKSDRFLEWLEKSGARVSSKIEVADLRHRSAGRGVLAKDDIGEDEELFSIPRSVILDVTTSTLPEELRATLEDPWLSLILAMVHEYRLGESSAFKPYFDVLPDTFDTLMYWTDAELEYLNGSAVVNKIGKKRADAVFNEKVLPVIRQHPDTCHAADIDDQELIALCHRMGSLIMAYAFDLESSNAPAEAGEEWEEDSDVAAVLPKGMIPLADMLNADADRNNAKLFYENDGTVVMKALKPVMKGEEVFNDYGPLPRADVLRRYGYVTDNYAKYDVVEISNNLIRDAAKDILNMDKRTFDERLDYLSEHGLEDDSWDISHLGSEDGQFSEELQIVLNTIFTDRPDFEKLKRKDKLPKAELSEKALQLLHSILIHRAKMYPSDDTSLTRTNSIHCISSSTPTERRRSMALAVIEGEKQVLQEAQEKIKALIDSATGEKRKVHADEVEAGAQQATKKQKR